MNNNNNNRVTHSPILMWMGKLRHFYKSLKEIKHFAELTYSACDCPRNEMRRKLHQQRFQRNQFVMKSVKVKVKVTTLSGYAF